jgi:uncharacterized membrane protein YphA (DoxX/SURF4 family)
MSLSAKLRRAPLRIATGAYIVNSGISKLGADDDAAKSLQATASGTYPVVDKAEPKVFAKAFGVGEIAVGAALLLPVVPTFVAGAALVGFSGALLNMYWNTPGMHEQGSPRPTPQGMPVAKDVWMMGIGLGLMADAAFEPAHDRVIELETTVSRSRAAHTARARRKASKAARRANTEHLKQARAAALAWQEEAAKRAKKARKKAGKRAGRASDTAAARLAELRTEYAPAAVDKARAAREAARQAAQEYGPVAADKARAAREAAKDFAEEYGPVAAEKARAAREAAKGFAEEYGPVAAEKARAAREAAKDLADEYRPVAARKAKIAKHAAQEYTAKAQKYGAKARDRMAG